MTYYSSDQAIADATLDLIDEVHYVEDPAFMHAAIMHRFKTQPEAMAQVLMCLTFWAETGWRNSGPAVELLAIARVKAVLESGQSDGGRAA
ncbi:hypothetical protein QSJ18_18360 [Gordonia sp. ABSL1-1]|uniref:hypothetical protein n=1 Tax=Gordonia sp. ABSL1-1 TaxID=3053923 RepID=UPI002573ECD8|nr:hypothetical protein [Gordonia sp. ABSL1-1]MDL9938714.1 hypothetical protein [Gordonia sp. ABSL1-1]